MNALPERCRTFRALHASGSFVLPNPWDVGSARVLADDGKAIERSSDLPVLVAENTSDRKVPIEVWRDRKPTTLSVGTTNT